MRNKPWTGVEQKTCSTIYTTEGLQAAMKYTGRSRHSVKHKMKELGVSSTYDRSQTLKFIERKFYAEDIAVMFEMVADGVKSSIIGEYFNTTSISIRSTMCLARKNGIQMYPKRTL
tara:strand:- start:3795 stop:4142 length:348 start_codon:yes stop_codon:yes gene_type:complete